MSITQAETDAHLQYFRDFLKNHPGHDGVMAFYTNPEFQKHLDYFEENRGLFNEKNPIGMIIEQPVADSASSYLLSDYDAFGVHLLHLNDYSTLPLDQNDRISHLDFTSHTGLNLRPELFTHEEKTATLTALQRATLPDSLAKNWDWLSAEAKATALILINQKD